jgi:hypothetical protein
MHVVSMHPNQSTLAVRKTQTTVFLGNEESSPFFKGNCGQEEPAGKRTDTPQKRREEHVLATENVLRLAAEYKQLLTGHSPSVQTYYLRNLMGLLAID